MWGGYGRNCGEVGVYVVEFRVQSKLFGGRFM